jgi:hypothetical protein
MVIYQLPVLLVAQSRDRPLFSAAHYLHDWAAGWNVEIHMPILSTPMIEHKIAARAKSERQNSPIGTKVRFKACGNLRFDPGLRLLGR